MVREGTMGTENGVIAPGERRPGRRHAGLLYISQWCSPGREAKVAIRGPNSEYKEEFPNNCI